MLNTFQSSIILLEKITKNQLREDFVILLGKSVQERCILTVSYIFLEIS